MIIRSVRLTNILSHDSTEVFFPDGVVSIVGPNGAGKSSIIDSIYIAMFSDAKPDVRGGKKEYIVMRGKRRGEISVAFEVGGSRYLVVREVSVDGTSDAYLYLLEGDRRRLKARGIPQVVAEVGRMLGLTTISPTDVKRVVRGTIISLQDELTKIIDIRDSERKEWILSLLGLSYLERALESVKRVTSERSRLEGELRSELKNLDRIRRDLEELRRRVNELTARVKEVEGRVNELRPKKEYLGARLRTLDDAVSIASKLKTALIASRARDLEVLVNRLGPLSGWDSSEYSRLVSELRRRTEELENLRKQHSGIVGEIRSKLGVAVGSLEELSKLAVELRSRHEELSSSISARKALRDLYAVYIERFEVGSRCPICGSLISDPSSVRERLARELVSLNDSIRRLGAEHSLVDVRLRAVERYLEKARELASREEYLAGSIVRELESRVGQLRSLALGLCRDVLGMRADESSVDRCIEALNESRNALQRAKNELEVVLRDYGDVLNTYIEGVSVGDTMARLTTVLMDLGIGLGGIASVQDVDSAVGRLLDTKRGVEEELKRVADELSRLEGELRSLGDRIAEYKGMIGKLEGEVREREVLVKELERRIRAYYLVEEFATRFLGKSGLIAKELTRVVRTELERRANTILAKLGLRPITINEEFQIGIRVLGDELPSSNASGGEKVGISIALRLTLAELIMGRSPTTLILDEPTVYLDEERRAQIFKIINELGRTLRQVIVVTHDEDVINISDKAIRVESVNEVSKAYNV